MVLTARCGRSRFSLSSPGVSAQSPRLDGRRVRLISNEDVLQPNILVKVVLDGCSV